MKPHPGIRKTVKWTGAVVLAVLVAAWMGSAWWNLTWRSSSHGCVGVGGGSVMVIWSEDHVVISPPPMGWYVERRNAEFSWWFDSFDDPIGLHALALPIWLAPLATLIPTGLLWALDIRARRRARIGHCTKCNYDRRGLPGASPCPECGAAPAPSSAGT